MSAKLWEALSDIFIDNDVPFEFIARRVKDYTMDDIEHALFYEVAPVCAPNLSVLGIPPIWLGFAIDTLKPEIEAHLARYKADRLYRFKTNCLVRYYKFKFKTDWITLQRHINGYDTKNS